MKLYKIFAIVFRFPTGVENMGVALQNLMGGGLNQYMGEQENIFPRENILLISAR